MDLIFHPMVRKINGRIKKSMLLVFDNSMD